MKYGCREWEQTKALLSFFQTAQGRVIFRYYHILLGQYQQADSEIERKKLSLILKQLIEMKQEEQDHHYSIKCTLQGWELGNHQLVRTTIEMQGKIVALSNREFWIHVNQSCGKVSIPEKYVASYQERIPESPLDLETLNDSITGSKDGNYLITSRDIPFQDYIDYQKGLKELANKKLVKRKNALYQGAVS